MQKDAWCWAVKGFVWHRLNMHIFLHAFVLQYLPSSNTIFPWLFLSISFALLLLCSPPPLHTQWLIVPLPLPNDPGPLTLPTAANVVEACGTRGPCRGPTLQMDSTLLLFMSTMWRMQECIAVLPPMLSKPPWPVCEMLALRELEAAW